MSTPATRAPVRVCDATEADWPQIWGFFEPIVAAGETLCYRPDLTFEQGRDLWMVPGPGRTVIGIDPSGRVLGSATMYANRPGPGDHVASGSFMVEPSASGQGVGRALSTELISWARRLGFDSIQFNAVVETNRNAVHLYESLGFQIMGTLPGGFRHHALGPVGLHSIYLLLDAPPGRAEEPD